MKLIWKLMLWLLPIVAMAMDFESFYKQVHKQSLEHNPITFRGRNLYSLEAYHHFNQSQKEAAIGSLILVFDKLDGFIYFNEMSGVGIKTQNGSYLQFDIRYYENLEQIGLGGKIHAMCVLPQFDKCILLGRFRQNGA